MGLLDKIVKELDKGNLSIEKIFEKYKDGIELCNELNGFIKELEGKVEYIESSLKGD
ncbi:exodeoxyribonuclease VII small subunit [Candidatus Arthromitus sp. SFB-mouse-Yit]|nr:exodeoxyribonuclease VII small subunit [Candidatus Arthromitus sp. SFB-mouse-Yit]